MSALWSAVVNERGADGKRHYWNSMVEANDPTDAAEQALAGFDPERVDGVDVERIRIDYSYGRTAA